MTFPSRCWIWNDCLADAQDELGALKSQIIW